MWVRIYITFFYFILSSNKREERRLYEEDMRRHPSDKLCTCVCYVRTRVCSTRILKQGDPTVNRIYMYV